MSNNKQNSTDWIYILVSVAVVVLVTFVAFKLVSGIFAFLIDNAIIIAIGAAVIAAAAALFVSRK